MEGVPSRGPGLSRALILRNIGSSTVAQGPRMNIGSSTVLAMAYTSAVITMGKGSGFKGRTNVSYWWHT